MISDHSDRALLDLLSLRGRAAVVTGGAGGIGAATVRRLAEAGGSVVIADRDMAAAQATADHIAETTGSKVVAILADVADSATLGAAADLAVSTFGRLDIWVNNAGIYPTTGPAIDVDDEFIDTMMRINVRGTFAGAREAARRMTSGGVIVNLVSTAGFAPLPHGPSPASCWRPTAATPWATSPPCSTPTSNGRHTYDSRTHRRHHCGMAQSGAG